MIALADRSVIERNGKILKRPSENDRFRSDSANCVRRGLSGFCGGTRAESESSNERGEQRFARTTRLSQIRINELHTPRRSIASDLSPIKARLYLLGNGNP